MSMLRSAGAVLIALSSIGADPAGAIRLRSEAREHEFILRKGPLDSFDSIGRIECADPQAPRRKLVTTGWLIGNNQTVVTAAHAFYRQPSQRPSAPPIVIDPHECIFVLFQRDQRVRAIFGIRYALSPWADPARRGDISHDVAIARLNRPAIGAAIPFARTASGFRGTKITLYAYRSTIHETQLLHESHGVIERFSDKRARIALARRQGLRISDPSVLLVSSANTMSGSSGGMYFHPAWDAAIGIHLGHLCSSHSRKATFNPRNCFNYGRFFSREMFEWVDGVGADKPFRSYLIRIDAAR